jgi:hypothetical protein
MLFGLLIPIGQPKENWKLNMVFNLFEQDRMDIV